MDNGRGISSDASVSGDAKVDWQILAKSHLERGERGWMDKMGTSFLCAWQFPHHHVSCRDLYSTLCVPSASHCLSFPTDLDVWGAIAASGRGMTKGSLWPMKAMAAHVTTARQARPHRLCRESVHGPYCSVNATSRGHPDLTAVRLTANSTGLFLQSWA